MVHEHTIKYSASLVLRKMQIITTMRYQFIPVSWAKIKKSGDEDSYIADGRVIWYILAASCELEHSQNSQASNLTFR